MYNNNRKEVQRKFKENLPRNPGKRQATPKRRVG
jgi:hypothetical protein